MHCWCLCMENMLYNCSNGYTVLYWSFCKADVIGITYDGLITRSCKVVHQDFEVEKYLLFLYLKLFRQNMTAIDKYLEVDDAEVSDTTQAEDTGRHLKKLVTSTGRVGTLSSHHVPSCISSLINQCFLHILFICWFLYLFTVKTH